MTNYEKIKSMTSEEMAEFLLIYILARYER